MIILISGSKQFENGFEFSQFVKPILKNIQHRMIRTSDIIWVDGGARGTDALARDYWKRYLSIYGVKQKTIEADWDDLITPPLLIKPHKVYDKKYNVLAEYVKNKKMIDYALTDKQGCCLIAFPFGESKETRDIINRAEKAKIKTYIKEITERL